MKINTKIITITASVALCATACTDLSETVYSIIPADDFGKTEEQAFSIVFSAYSGLRGATYDGARGYAGGEYIYYMGALAADEAILPACNEGKDWLDGYRYMELLFHDFAPGSEATTGAWRYCYQNIANINAIMSQTIAPLDIDSTAKKRINAEMRALRAYYYFRLIDWFGNVPIVKSFNDTTLPTNAPRAEVFQYAVSELEDAIAYLPINGYGRMTRNAGLCLLSRFYLNGYVFTKTDYDGETNNYGNDPDGYYAKAVAACDSVSNIILEPNYFTNFLERNEVSNEILFCVVYDRTNDGTGAWGNWHVTHTSDEYMKYLVSNTGTTDGYGTGTIRVKPGVYASFEAADKRREAVRVGVQYKPNGDPIELTYSDSRGEHKNVMLNFIDEIQDIIDVYRLEGAHWMKYELVDDPSESQYTSNHDLVLMRYAEILLNRAEALIRLGRSGEASNDVQRIRSRAGLGAPASLTLAAIELERRHEFCFEDMRRTDMIRFGSFTKLAWLDSRWSKQVTERQPKYGKYTTLYPIPSLEMAKNPLLQQNEGY
ncbi:MAG: RagB/SusD family nutrient uptake outer membrane protein [Prevotellaceae bacterium]|nr:RagB/SusD family nutrient uptake outer membrane protein [Prevotellaceae bacterium]